MRFKSEALILAFIIACFALCAYAIIVSGNPSEAICENCG